MSGNVKTGLSHQEKITQKDPSKRHTKNQRAKPMTESAPSDGKPGSFKIKI